MKTTLLSSILICLSFFNLKAQTTGGFQKTIDFNSTSHTLAYYVPTNYNSSVSYPLVVALHGCGGNAIAFRNSLISLSDSLDAIILCPDFMTNQISGISGQIIPNAIDTTIIDLGYNIDTNKVFLIGFSCNGQETYKHGWNSIYPFAGIIPFNSWIPSIAGGYNFQSKIPTCICTGNQDGSYSNNVTLYNSLINNNGIGKLNSMNGIGHVWNFSTRDNELMECFNWMNSLVTTSITNRSNQSRSFEMYPNPAKDVLHIKNKESEKIEIVIYNITGKVIFESTSTNNNISINTSNYSNGIYFTQLKTKQKVIWMRKFVIQN